MLQCWSVLRGRRVLQSACRTPYFASECRALQTVQPLVFAQASRRYSPTPATAALLTRPSMRTVPMKPVTSVGDAQLMGRFGTDASFLVAPAALVDGGN